MHEAAVQLSDHQLLSAVAQARDRVAFAELLQRHQAACYNLALRITCREDAAAEAVQEAFLKIWTSAGQYTHESNARGWIMKIVARESLTQLRSRRKHRAIEQRESRRQHAAAADAPAATAERTELLRVLRQLLELLPDADRQLVALYYGGELSQDEIARSLNMPQRTVSHRLAQALDALREGLARAGFAALAPVLLHEHVTQALCTGTPVPVSLQAGILQVLDRAPLPKLSHRFSRRVRTMRETSMLPYVAGGLMALGMVVFLATSAQHKPAAAERRVPEAAASAISEPPAARKPFEATWDFNQGMPDGVKMAGEKLEWQRHAKGWGEAVFLPGEAKALLLPFDVRVPFVLEIKQRAYITGGGQQFLGCCWSDGSSTTASRQWGTDATLKRSYDPHEYRFYFVDQYMLMNASGIPELTIAEYRQAYAGNHLAIMGCNSAVLRITARELTAQEIKTMRVQTAEVVRSKQPSEWLLVRNLQILP